jgi:hypothetical protein
VTGVDEQEMHVECWWGDLFEDDLLDEQERSGRMLMLGYGDGRSM